METGEETIFLALNETFKPKFELERWDPIAAKVHAQVMDEYAIAFLRKQYKKLTTAWLATDTPNTATEGAVNEDAARTEERNTRQRSARVSARISCQAQKRTLSSSYSILQAVENNGLGVPHRR